MTSETQVESWIATLQGVDMPIERLVLALRVLGISAAVIGRLLSRDSLEIDRLAGDALSRCADTQVTSPDTGYMFDIEPVGRAAIERLLQAGDFPVSDNTFTFSWVPDDYVFSIEKGPDGRLRAVSEATRLEFSLNTDSGFLNWFEEMKMALVAGESRNELFVMLPLTTPGISRWTILRPQRDISRQDDALRLIGSLSSLGFGYRRSGHRTNFFSNLVWQCQMLFDEIGVSGAHTVNRPQNDLLVRQTSGLANNALVMRQARTSLTDRPPAQVFVANFSDAWKDNPNQFDCWKLRNRAKDFDEMAEALIWLMTRTSGICLQLPLPPRTTNKIVRNVQVLAPKPWIDFVRVGHGAQRGNHGFAPYRKVGDGQSPLYYVAEPYGFSHLKKLENQAK